jgi:RNA polymerase sigma-70 factor (ECF subfamily)
MSGTNPSEQRPQEHSKCHQRGTSVLCIDDEMTSGDALIQLLALDGFGVECVQTGLSGLTRAREGAWQAVLLDLHLPDIPGVQVLETLQRQGIGCPIVVITGWHLDDACENAARRIGAADFRRKPLDVEDLASSIRTAAATFSHGLTAPADPDVSAANAAAPTITRYDQHHEIHWLHARILLGDEHAREQLLARMLPDLVQRVRQQFRAAPGDLVSDAVVDALLDYVSRPGRFDSGRNVPLFAFLVRAAACNVINSLEAERRRRVREARYADDAAARAKLPETVESRYTQILIPRPHDVASDGAERRAYELWRAGERRTGVFATALGLSGLAPLDQRREVKRFKDRLLKRIRRRIESKERT